MSIFFFFFIFHFLFTFPPPLCQAQHGKEPEKVHKKGVSQNEETPQHNWHTHTHTHTHTIQGSALAVGVFHCLFFFG